MIHPITFLPNNLGLQLHRCHDAIGDDCASNLHYGLRDFCQSVKAARVENLVEIGTYRGASTAIFATYFPNANIVTLDIAPQSEAAANLAPFSNVTLLRTPSLEFVPRSPVDLLYIDGEHSTDQVLRELMHFIPYMNQGSMVAGHDFDWASVSKAVQDFFGRPPDRVFRDHTWLYFYGYSPASVSQILSGEWVVMDSRTGLTERWTFFPDQTVRSTQHHGRWRVLPERVRIDWYEGRWDDVDLDSINRYCAIGHSNTGGFRRWRLTKSGGAINGHSIFPSVVEALLRAINGVNCIRSDLAWLQPIANISTSNTGAALAICDSAWIPEADVILIAHPPADIPETHEVDWPLTDLCRSTEPFSIFGPAGLVLRRK